MIILRGENFTSITSAYCDQCGMNNEGFLFIPDELFPPEDFTEKEDTFVTAFIEHLLKPADPELMEAIDKLQERMRDSSVREYPEENPTLEDRS